MPTDQDIDALRAATAQYADAVFAYRRARATLDQSDAKAASFVRADTAGRVTEGIVREQIDQSPTHVKLLLALHTAERTKSIVFGELQVVRIQLGLIGGVE
jgi:hypothetical protein